MRVREARLLAKRELILQRAGELFYSCGYESTSMKDIAEACNLGMNAIYSVFSSKEQICAELFLLAQEAFSHKFKQTLIYAENLPATNRFLMDLYIDFYSRHNFLYEIVWLVLSGQIQAELNKKTVEAIHQNFLELLDIYRSYLEKLKREAVVHCKHDLNKLTSTFWCMMSGLAANYVHKTGDITGVCNLEMRELELDMVLEVLKYDSEKEKKQKR